MQAAKLCRLPNFCFMKNFILLFFGIQLIAVHTCAQATNNVLSNDTTRVVLLQEVFVKGLKKTTQQQLVGFYQSNNAATLEDILARVPEISLIRRGAYGMEPSIRYFNGSQINVQLDGMNIHGACTDKMDPATIYIEPINLENLQIQTANSGFMNGSSIGGTMNMKMAEPNYLSPDKLTGSFNSGYQSAAKSLYESIRLNYTTKKWAIAASVTYRNNQNYRSGGGAIIPYSQFEKVNYSLSAKYQQNETSYFKIDLLGDDGWNIGYTALPMDVGYAAARIGSMSYHQENPRKRLYNWSIKIYSNSVRHFMDDSKRPLVPMHMDMPGESKTSGIYSEAEYKINYRQKLLLRVDGSSTFLKASMTMYDPGQPSMYMLTWPDNRKNQFGAAASWLYQFDSSTLIKLSARVDFISSQITSTEAKNHVSIFDPTFNGRNDFLKNISAQVTKNIDRRLKLTTGISYSERMPSANELFGFYLFNASDGYDYIGNPQLNTEKSLQADLSLKYSWKKNSFQLNYYYARVQNFIVGKINPTYSTMTIGANGVKTYLNLTNASVSGAEFSGLFNPLKAVDLISTIRYTHAIDQNRIPLPFVAPLKNINSIRFQPTRFSAQIETESTLKQNKINPQYGEDATEGYVLLHLRFGYQTQLFKNIIEIQSGIENLFDKQYHEHLDWGNIQRPGRNLYVQLKYRFN